MRIALRAHLWSFAVDVQQEHCVVQLQLLRACCHRSAEEDVLAAAGAAVPGLMKQQQGQLPHCELAAAGCQAACVPHAVC